MKLDDYLKEIQSREESLFPMDSPHTGQGPLRGKKKTKDLNDDPIDKIEEDQD